ncbi:hypothetical protein F4680DRAFT_456278 [Xylaria scruposa]|nr:hypothetical protein F4680DRAFT_456278 [Xylaria scruposa]
MATTPPLSDESFVLTAPAVNAQYHDPFNSSGPTHHRFSNFDAQLFALGPNASPAQAKRALEAHLAETDRRMEEAGKLGTALVQQRNELTERLKEVEKLQAEGELSDDLRQKLVEIERDYNEVARDSARAFLPKSRVPSNEAAAGSPFALEGKGGKRSVSPSKFEAQATASPTKLSVPNRKIRNQPSNRIHDIEFAAEISTSLIAQVRNLQGLLAEREEELKDTRAENSKLEYEVEGFQQRLKALDDNEHRYKDENWNLETQIHELMAKEKEAADREKKLTQALNILQSEKNAGQRELDEIKLTHSKLVEEHTAAVKHHDIELGTAKRTMVMGESERAAMQKKIEELTGQNTELAKAVSVSIRGRKLERESIMGMSEDDFQTARDSSTPDQSPPASPVKGTPRHSMLESETLKTSLAHAQRTIQSLRTNVHREKTEKMETRRLLQEARDEIEKMRSEPVVPTRRARKTESREFKRPPPRLLGGLRSARSEIFVDDPNWEDQSDILPHPSSSPVSRETTMLFDPVPEQTEHFETANETANETSDAAFETANEHATETDDFHTGAEEFTSDDAETETESPLKRRTLKGRPPSLFPMHRTGSIDSTASTEDEDFPYGETRTPPSLPPIHARFPLRVSRGAFRRSRNPSEDHIFQSSPASLPTSSNMGTPQQHVQSLAAELGDFDGSDNESNMSATPSRRSTTRGRTMSPPPALPPLPRVIMVDSGMMTEPVHELSASLKDAVSTDRPVSMHTVVSRFSLGSEYSDVGAKLAEFPSPPTASPKKDVASMPELALSTMAALRAEHEEQLNKLTAENAAAHAAAIAVLKSQHADEFAAAKDAHAHELESLRSSHSLKAAHAEELSRKEMESAAAHASASLKAAHSDELIAHAEELDRKESESNAAHAQELSQKETESATTLASELEALKHKAARDAEIEALKAAHIEEISQREAKLNAAASKLSNLKAENEAIHAAELAALLEAHATHAREFEDLKSSHADQIDQAKRLKSSHLQQIDSIKNSINAAHNEELESLRAAHAKQIEDTKIELTAAQASALASLSDSHHKQLEDTKNKSLKANKDAAHTGAIATLIDSHKKQIDEVKGTLNATHAQELERLKASHAKQLEELGNARDTAHATAVAAMADGEAAMSRELIETLNGQHAAAHAKELEGFKAALAKQIDQQIEALNAAHAEIIEAHKHALKSSHDRQVETLNSEHAHLDEMKDLRAEHAAARTGEVEELTNKHLDELNTLKSEHTRLQEELGLTHSKDLETLRQETEAAHSKDLESLHAQHVAALASLSAQHEASQSQLREELGVAHSKEIEANRQEINAAHSNSLESLQNQHVEALAALKKDHEISHSQLREELGAVHSKELEALRHEIETTHSRELEVLHQEISATHLKEIESLHTKHAKDLEALKTEHETTIIRQLKELEDSHSQKIAELQQESEDAKSKELTALGISHAQTIDSLKGDHEAELARKMQEIAESHAHALDELRQQNKSDQSLELTALSTKHQDDLEKLRGELESLDTLKAEHARVLSSQVEESNATVIRELDALKAEHELILESHIRENAAEREYLLASHAAELEALRTNLTVAPPALGYSPLSSIETEPIESPEIRSPRREAFIIPQDKEPMTPHARSNGRLDRQHKSMDAPFIAEDDTRQSPSAIVRSETPDSQQPFKEITTNTDGRSLRKPVTITSHQGSQTTLTADGLDRLMKNQRHQVGGPFDEIDAITPSTVRRRRPSTDSFGSVVRANAASEHISIRRPGSSASTRSATQNMPPLPQNHREVIEAARSHSAHGSKGAMGPPLLPASAYRPSSSRSQTPSNRPPLSPSSVVKSSTLTPRAKTPGYADVQSSSRVPMRSRQSSISSFASEIDTRFNIHNGMGIDPSGFGSNTDPRMIQAVTQTMIGEYLWKYTRKTGRGEMSENRHRRFFWVHPYTRALYWSDSDPAAGGRGEMKAKSVPIEAVRVVADDNPMPPGLHRKSLIVIAPGRTIKFTCTTGQRHETWFNALSYLLLRSGNEGKQDAEEVTGNITQDDVDEFNPSIHRRSENDQRPRPPPSLSSYNSRTTRNESPAMDTSMSIPTLTPTHEKEAARNGTFGKKLSGYWKSGNLGRGTFSSLRNRSYQPYDSAIYEASEVPDSAEDLRQIIEQQDRESDRLENVRACCDGKTA